jgi:4-hydroxybenzoate polyprenyltransferase
MTTTEEQIDIDWKIVKGIIGTFRLTHFLPVVTVTLIAAAVSFISLDGFQPVGLFITIVLVVFFQQSFLGIQNDYLDWEVDKEYGKRKAIVDGWVKPMYAFWCMVVCYVIFTVLSFVVVFLANASYWSPIFVQGANLVGIFYNYYAKSRPISILPYFIGFPLVPLYVWITVGGFEELQLWILPIISLVSFPAHIANELPDYELDKEYDRVNFAVFTGETLATILYWLGVILNEVIITIVYFLYSLNTLIFAIVVGSSALIAVIAFILLWRNNWKTNLMVFNVVTLSIGIEVIGFFLLISL